MSDNNVNGVSEMKGVQEREREKKKEGGGEKGNEGRVEK